MPRLAMSITIFLFFLCVLTFEANASLFGSHVIAGIFGNRPNQNENGEVYSNKIESNAITTETNQLQQPPPPSQPRFPSQAINQDELISTWPENKAVQTRDYGGPIPGYGSHSPDNFEIPHSFNADNTIPLQQQDQNMQSQFQYQAPSGYFVAENVQPNDPHVIDVFDGRQREAHYMLQSMENDLIMSLRREQDLLEQINNLTVSLGKLEKRDKLHLHQLDLLTERFMDLEMLKAKDYNEMLEYRENCTEQALEIAILEGNVEEWRIKCSDLTEMRDDNKKNIDSLKLKLIQASKKTEELAFLVEHHRLAEEDDQTERRTDKSRPRRGFLSWLFGFSDARDTDDDDKSELYGIAKSTLMTALQTERDNVHELEAALANLQLNYSISSDQLRSRDSIINVLNDRVAVFEEDKAVLKAALRQLQKEMSDEAVATQEISDELGAAREEVERLHNEISSLIASHKTEIENLRKKLQKKDEKIVKLESNLTSITMYVNKLEERLGDFTVTRRDLDQQNENNELSKKHLIQMQQERDLHLSKMHEMEKEREEIKRLLDLVATERVQLIKQNNQTAMELNSLKASERALRNTCSKLNVESKELQAQNGRLNEHFKKFEVHVNAAELLNGNLQKGYNNATVEMALLRTQIASLLKERESVQELLTKAEKGRVDLEQKVSAMQNLIETAEKQKRDAQNTAREAEKALQLEVDAKNAQVGKFSREFSILADEVKKSEDDWKAEKERMIEESQRVIEKLRLELESSALNALNKQKEHKEKVDSAVANRRVEDMKVFEDAARLKDQAEQLDKERNEFEATQKREKAKLTEEATILLEERTKLDKLIASEDQKQKKMKNDSDLLSLEKSNLEEAMRILEQEREQMQKQKEEEAKKKLEFEVRITNERKFLELERKRLGELKKVEPMRSWQEESQTRPKEIVSQEVPRKDTNSKFTKTETEANSTSPNAKRNPTESFPRNFDERNPSMMKVPTIGSKNVSGKVAFAPDVPNVSITQDRAHDSDSSYILERGPQTNIGGDSTRIPQSQSGSLVNISSNQSSNFGKRKPLIYQDGDQQMNPGVVGPRLAKPIPIGRSIANVTQSSHNSINSSSISLGSHPSSLKDRRQENSIEKPRKVAFRTIRKTFSRATGFHGVFTKPSSATWLPNKTMPLNRRPIQSRNTTLPISRLQPGNAKAKQTNSIRNATIPDMSVNLSASVESTKVFAPRILNQTNATIQPKPSEKKLKGQTNNIPLRKIRKMFASVTGIHGVFRKPSDERISVDKGYSGKSVHASQGFSAGAKSLKTSVASSQQVPQSKPNLVKHTVSGIEYPNANFGSKKSR